MTAKMRLSSGESSRPLDGLQSPLEQYRNIRGGDGEHEGPACDNLPTIGDSRRQGMTTFSVHCGAPCGHVSKLTFDALRLPDQTYFIDIPKRRRLRCSSCGRRATEISATWNEVAQQGNGRRPLSGWVVVAKAPDGVEMRSNALPSRERAIGLAFDLADRATRCCGSKGPAAILRRKRSRPSARRGDASGRSAPHPLQHS